MFLFVSGSNEILNIGEKATQLLNGLVGQFDDSIIDDVLDFIQNGAPSARLAALAGSDLHEIKDFSERSLKMQAIMNQSKFA